LGFIRGAEFHRERIDRPLLEFYPRTIVTLESVPSLLFGAFTEVSMLMNECLPSFDETVLPHFNAAYNLARWLMRNEHDAEDAVQQACLRAFRFFPGFRGGDGRAWLMRIVRNTCYSLLRAKRPMQDASEFDENVTPPDSCPPNPEDVLLHNDIGDLVRKALEELPVNFREVVILR
jgi:RNA polymerase sigma-70 factor (ECF subfamily)